MGQLGRTSNGSQESSPDSEVSSHQSHITKRHRDIIAREQQQPPRTKFADDRLACTSTLRGGPSEQVERGKNSKCNTNDHVIEEAKCESQKFMMQQEQQTTTTISTSLSKSKIKSNVGQQQERHLCNNNIHLIFKNNSINHRETKQRQRMTNEESSQCSRYLYARLSHPMTSILVLICSVILISVAINGAQARITFEKMTNRDYSGSTYYTIQNVSLFECLGWCREEISCTSAVFSFVVNPFAALQETTCQLQNETQARQGAYMRRDLQTGDQMTIVAHPQKANNLYFFNKVDIQTESVCNRLWAFERFPNRRLRQRDRPSFHAPNKEACQAACMSEQRFVCRSLEYNYISQQCSLSGLDRRSPIIIHLTQAAVAAASLGGGSHGGDLIESAGIDYFENACLLGEDICNDSRLYDYAKVGLAPQRTAHFVELNYYPDKEMLVKSQAGCARACTIEHEFICRSILYRSTFKQGQPNCALYHLDQRTFPDGADTFLGPMMQPLLDSGETSAIYLEAICNDTIQLSPTTITMPPTSISIMPSATTPGAISIQPGSHSQHSNNSSNNFNNNNNNNQMVTPSNMDEPTRFLVSSPSPSSSSLAPVSINFSSSTSTLSPITSALANLQAGSTTIKVPSNAFLGSGNSDGRIPDRIQIPTSSSSSPMSTSGSSSSSISRPPQHITIGPPSPMSSSRQPMPQHITISPAPSPTRPFGADSIPTNIQIMPGNQPPSNHEQNCDSHGFCYDVSLKCTDTKMVINVKTQRPFFGRIYALGRSETCNANIKNQNQFQLDMYLTGQECNTQSASGTYTNTIVLQHHNVVLTKADKVYHVRCTYETSSRNVSFGMMPVKDMFEVDVNDRNQETISITASLDAPLPKISIQTADGKEASTVRIGDRLTFRIEIPENTPYGIFARSCVAMAKDARSTFEIIDENGCPVDHTIFPNFQQASIGNALESNYEAFRFTESYGVIFQCNVKYCIGKCEPVNCGIGRDSVESFGRRRKRSIGGSNETVSQQAKRLASNEDMTLSREIVVLDLTEKENTNNVPSSDSPGSFSNGGKQHQQQASSTTTTSSLLADGETPGQLSDVGPPSSLRSSNHNNYPSSSLSYGGHEHANHHQRTRLPKDPNDNDLASKHCLSSQSLSLLICSIGLIFVLYVCLVACMFARKDSKISHIKQQFY